MKHSLDALSSGYLTGQLLVATPSVQGDCFARSVIFCCAHNDEGAMGVIVNHPMEEMDISEVLQQLNIPETHISRALPIHFGGPVEGYRGFVLHSVDAALEDSLIIGDIALTANTAILRDIAQGKGPHAGMLTLGYAGWAPGQLESEIEQGSWIVAPASPDLIFAQDNESKWIQAAAALGVDITRVSGEVGHA